MNRNHAFFGILATAGVAVAAACRDGSTPTGPAGAGAAPVAQATQAPDPVALARSVPGFGGFYLDNGVPTVFLTDVGQRAAAEAALGRYAQARGFAPSQIRVLRGEYRYARLEDWFSRISLEALAHAGVVFVDLDEARNRVVVGVENAAAAATVRAVVARLGVPVGAVVLEETLPIRFVATLRDQVRPVVGGLQINFSNFLCTLSFNATSGTENSFIVNSHCTDRQGGTEGTLYYQPLASVANSFIGTEADDPQYFRNSNGCPRSRKCRFSDAARAAYAAGVTFTLGGIAQTTGANNGSIELTGQFAITGEAAEDVVGQTVNKVGRTTGWTQGLVTRTGVNTGVLGSNIVLLGQTWVNAGVGAGDSGSPVFGIAAGNDVTLHGILWGGTSDGATFVFSPLVNVERELGPLATF